MNKRLFNIYYLNLSKVYELAMILNNRVLNSLTREALVGKEKTKNRKSGISANYMDLFGAEIGEDNTIKTYQSNKVIETLEVKTTKSVLLRNILDKCKKITKTSKLSIGDLVYIDDVELCLENGKELRAFKMLRNDAIRGLQYEGIDLNNLITSMLNDYSYNLTGKGNNLSQDVLIKIPMIYGNEFENLYTIDDLLIGKVSVIGIYRGKAKKEDLKNSYKVFSEDNNDTKQVEFNYDVSDEVETENTVNSSTSSDEYNFIDIISIIQNVNANIPVSNEKNNNKSFNILKRFIDWFRGNKNA